MCVPETASLCKGIHDGVAGQQIGLDPLLPHLIKERHRLVRPAHDAVRVDEGPVGDHRRPHALIAHRRPELLHLVETARAGPPVEQDVVDPHVGRPPAVLAPDLRDEPRGGARVALLAERIDGQDQRGDRRLGSWRTVVAFDGVAARVALEETERAGRGVGAAEAGVAAEERRERGERRRRRGGCGGREQEEAPGGGEEAAGGEEGDGGGGAGPAGECRDRGVREGRERRAEVLEQLGRRGDAGCGEEAGGVSSAEDGEHFGSRGWSWRKHLNHHPPSSRRCSVS